jgi:hypothetical protein
MSGKSPWTYSRVVDEAARFSAIIHIRVTPGQRRLYAVVHHLFSPGAGISSILNYADSRATKYDVPIV